MTMCCSTKFKTSLNFFQGDASDVQHNPSDAKSNKDDDFLLVSESNEESLSIDAGPINEQEEDVPTDFSDTTEDGDDNGRILLLEIKCNSKTKILMHLQL